MSASKQKQMICYAELAVIFPSGGLDHRQYSIVPTHGRMAEADVAYKCQK